MAIELFSIKILDKLSCFPLLFGCFIRKFMSNYLVQSKTHETSSIGSIADNLKYGIFLVAYKNFGDSNEINIKICLY